MPYTPQVWANGGPGAVNDDRLNYMETGIQTAQATAEAAGGSLTTVTGILDAYNTVNRSVGNSGNTGTYAGITSGWIDTIDTENATYIDLNLTGVITFLQPGFYEVRYSVNLAPASAASGLFSISLVSGGMGNTMANASRTVRGPFVPLANAGADLPQDINIFGWFADNATLTALIHQSSGSAKDATNIAITAAAYT